MIDSQETLVLFAKKYCTSIGRFSANYTTKDKIFKNIIILLKIMTTGAERQTGNWY